MAELRVGSAQSAFLDALEASLTEAAIIFRVNGHAFHAGAKNASPVFRIRVNNPRVFVNLLRAGNLGLGESYMHGDFEMEEGTLHDLLTVLLRAGIDKTIRKNPALATRIGWIRFRNAFRRRETNVRRHYDLGTDLFEAFLDPTLTYSCGYAKSADDSLECLQANKLDRICRKLRLRPGDRVLDIGCGFGGLLIFAAENYGISGTGITISPAQCDRAMATVQSHGLTGRVRVELREYRSVGGRYNKIVSVGMLEHVPRSEYLLYFRTIASALESGGLGLVHAISSTTPVNEHDPFIQKYIFPGSSQPCLSDMTRCLERCGLAVLDVENIVRHYGFTVLRWLERFNANRTALNAERHDEVFQRMWEYYFSCGIAAARASDAAVYQILFNNDRTANLPLVRV